MFYARSSHVEAGIKLRQQKAMATGLLIVSSQTEEERQHKAAIEKAVTEARAEAKAQAEAEYLAKLETVAAEAEANKEAAIIAAFALMGKEVPDQLRRTWREIADEVCAQTVFSVRCILGRSQNYEISAVRHLAILAVWAEREDLSLPRIGHFFGNRDHTTILNSLKRFGFDNRERAHAFVRKCLAENITAKQAIIIRKAA
ncbi:helix-turn-helix domain-containing protein [Ochrobactrum sp. EDr1-4]|uniref:helix-turn-helix domain-containing protein n=1 Tax=Ochrobactrum sp. EDr1-4 TaxID=3368622 RepID=UPI003BA02E35